MKNLSSITNKELLQAALETFERRLKETQHHITDLKRALRQEPAARDHSGYATGDLLQLSITDTTTKLKKRKARKLTAAGRKAIVEAQKKRWAEIRAASQSHGKKYIWAGGKKAS